jgi:formimidoylglutamase
MTSDPSWLRASEWLARNDTDPRLVVIGAPTSAASISPSEAWRTPPALREVLARFSTFDGEEGTELKELTVGDRGDWPIARMSAPDAIVEIGERASELEPGPVYAFLGGDNVITYPIVKALSHGALERFGVLTLDAHHDVRETKDGISNGTPIRALIEAGLPGDHVTQIGIHSFANSGANRSWAEDQGIQVVTMREVAERPIEAVMGDYLDDLAGRCDAIYVDVDIDVLDRAFAPGCPGARPGGMTPRQLATAARVAGAHESVVAVDFVEVDVTRDVAETTVMAMAMTFLAFASGVASRKG